MATFEPIIATLEQAAVRYVIVGGLAVVLQGYPRLTLDLDLVIDLDPDNVRRALDALEGAGVHPIAPVDAQGLADPATRRRWIEEKNMIVFSLRDPDEPTRAVDVFVEAPIDFAELWSHSQIVRLSSTDARIASIHHLIQMKRAAGRPIDLDDVEALEVIEQAREADGEGQ